MKRAMTGIIRHHLHWPRPRALHHRLCTCPSVDLRRLPWSNHILSLLSIPCLLAATINRVGLLGATGYKTARYMILVLYTLLHFEAAITPGYIPSSERS